MKIIRRILLGLFLFVLNIETYASNSYINDMMVMNEDEDSDIAEIEIKGNGESCQLSLGSDAVVYDTSCKKMVNSKGVNIYCTRKKKIFKTYNEVYAFIFKPKLINDVKMNFNKLSWKDIGIVEPSIKQEWILSGVKNPEEVQKWKALGISRPDRVWVGYGIKTPEEAKAWIASGYTNPSLINSWIQNNVRTPREATEWSGVGFGNSPQGKKEWAKLGFNTYSEVKKWLTLNIYISRMQSIG